MPSTPFQSFQRTPVLFLSVRTHGDLPFLANDDAHAILRDAWLQLAGRSGWFVGHYLLLPAQACLLVTAAPRAWLLVEWVRRWRILTTFRLSKCSKWQGKLWQPDFFHRRLESIDDYVAKATRLREAAGQGDGEPKDRPWRYAGMIWELQEWGRQDVLPVLNQSRRA